MKTVLFVTHKSKQCGVYEFGKQVFEVVLRSTKYRFVKAECDSLAELLQAVERIVRRSSSITITQRSCRGSARGLRKAYIGIT